jgi:protein-tyrosine phosphatase
MFDVHYHMLYGVDDGPKTIEESLELAEASIAEGVTHVVCSPHANATHVFDPAVNQERLDRLNERLDGRITLGLGCDFHLTYENVEDALRNRTRYTVNGHQYLLVEFPEFGISNFHNEVLYQLNSRGMVPIITHPERNPEFQAKPEKLLEWLQGDCLVQVTAGSLLGRFGRRAQAMSLNLVKKNWVHIVASDAHSVEGRPPSMGPAHRLLETRFGKETADRLCIDVPRAVYFGKPLPPCPEPEGLYPEPVQKKSFFSRVFSRT